MTDNDERKSRYSRMIKNLTDSEEDVREWTNSAGGQVLLLAIVVVLVLGFLWQAVSR